MNKFVLGALATAVAGGTSLASESEWPELDRELEALSSTYRAQAPGGPEFGGWIIGAWDYSSDITATFEDPSTPGEFEDKDLSGVTMRSARIYAMGEVGSYGYKLEFDFFDSEESLFSRFFEGLLEEEGTDPLFDSDDDDPTGHILDAYGEVNVADSFHLRLGRFRAPILSSALIDRNRTLFIDRSLLGSFFAFRDEGAMAHGEFEMVGWYLSIQNGFDGPADDYLFTGRVSVDILGDGAGMMNEGAYNASEDVSLRAAVAFADEGSLEDGTVIAGELYLTAGPFSLSGEIADLDEDINPFSAVTVMPESATPWAGTASYMISEAYEVAFRWEELDDPFDTRVFRGGLNWYHDDWNTKWQLEYATSDSDEPTAEVDVISLGLAVSF